MHGLHRLAFLWIYVSNLTHILKQALGPAAVIGFKCAASWLRSAILGLGIAMSGIKGVVLGFRLKSTYHAALAITDGIVHHSSRKLPFPAGESIRIFYVHVALRRSYCGTECDQQEQHASPCLPPLP